MSAEALFAAIQKNDPGAVRELLAADPSLVVARAPNGSSPVLMAVYYGRPELVRLFEEHGVQLDFFEACAAGREERALALLAEDPSRLQAWSADGFNGVGLALYFEHRALARTLIEQGADVHSPSRNAQTVRPIHAAAARGDVESAALLLARGADVNAPQQGGLTPLHGAAANGDRVMTQWLLEHGADRGIKAADGKTAADIAQDRGHAELAALLR